MATCAGGCRPDFRRFEFSGVLVASRKKFVRFRAELPEWSLGELAFLQSIRFSIPVVIIVSGFLLIVILGNPVHRKVGFERRSDRQKNLASDEVDRVSAEPSAARGVLL